jgi:hypothetical protein
MRACVACRQFQAACRPRALGHQLPLLALPDLRPGVLLQHRAQVRQPARTLGEPRVPPHPVRGGLRQEDVPLFPADEPEVRGRIPRFRECTYYPIKPRTSNKTLFLLFLLSLYCIPLPVKTCFLIFHDNFTNEQTNIGVLLGFL